MGKAKNVCRKAPKTDNVYVKLLVKVCSDVQQFVLNQEVAGASWKNNHVCSAAA